jgi:hypothetical protein
LGAGEAAHDAGIAPVAARQGEIGEELGDALIEDRAVVAAGLVAESTGKPTFADASRPIQDGQALVTAMGHFAVDEQAEPILLDALVPQDL